MLFSIKGLTIVTINLCGAHLQVFCSATPLALAVGLVGGIHLFSGLARAMWSTWTNKAALGRGFGLKSTTYSGRTFGQNASNF